MRYLPNALLLDILLEPFEMVNLDLRTLLQSFIHELISRRPELFFHVRPLYLKRHRFHRTTTQDDLWTFLHNLFPVSPDWKIGIAVNNVHLWPEQSNRHLRCWKSSFGP